jgi:hypothetical protein
MMVKNSRQIGAQSRPHVLRKLDGRTREAKRLRVITAELLAHIGGAESASAPQRYLVERTAIDILRLELFDAEMAAGTISNHDARVAHALRNTVRLALRELGMRQPAALVDPMAALRAHIARRDAEQGEAA